MTVSPDAATVSLVIENDKPWAGSDAQIRSLQEKIHTYVGYALDGDAAYPVLAGKTWIIEVATHVGRPDARTAHALDVMTGDVVLGGVV